MGSLKEITAAVPAAAEGREPRNFGGGTNDPLMDAKRAIAEHIRQCQSINRWPAELRASDIGKAILCLTAADRSAVASAVAARWSQIEAPAPTQARRSDQQTMAGIFKALLRAPEKFTIDSLPQLVDSVAGLNAYLALSGGFPLDRVAVVTDRAIARLGSLPENLRLSLRRWLHKLVPEPTPEAENQAARAALGQIHEGADYTALRKAADFLQWRRDKERTNKAIVELAEQVRRILAEPTDTPHLPVDPTDAVGAAVWATKEFADREAMPQWTALLMHAVSISGASPSGKWKKRAAQLVADLGAERFLSTIQPWCDALGEVSPVVRSGIHGSPEATTVPNSQTVDFLKGVVWSCSAANLAEASPRIGDLAVKCFTKIRNIGQRSPRLGNACASALAEIEGPAAIAQLARLKVRAKSIAVRAAIDKALRRVSQRTGLTPDDLIEISVPTHELSDDGTLRRMVGDHIAEIRAVGRDITLRWIDGKEKSTTSVPAAVKREYADEVRKLRKAVNDIGTEIATVTSRLEKLLSGQRSWTVQEWRQRFIDHPIAGPIAGRLIWRVGPAAVGFYQGQWVDANDRQIAPDTDAVVRIWHPISAKAGEVLSWREWLEQHALVQPFKQAHREVYLLTDAERVTGTYSNRFAAHVLRQHQMSALCGQRGWVYRLQGNFDSAHNPTLDLPVFSMRAEFFVEGIHEHTTSGIYTHVATDQVRFVNANGGVLPLDQIPPLVFCEVMRDVDLFVGVASVGNDPTWQDGGPDGRFRDYWTNYSFGELSTTAATRREVLARLVPRLKIADNCTLTDRFLIVRGSLRTYKIHLGSGNILMEPNDQYLCIVPDRSPNSKSPTVFLPFEGDSKLSVILSKAFMLAADEKIQDPTITRQIR